MSLFWILRTGLGVALATLFIAGCGNNSIASTSNTDPISRVASTSNAEPAVTREQAVAYAHAVNLRAGDVPGLLTIGGSSASEMEPLGSLSRCDVSTSPAGSIVAVGSPTFQRKQEHTNASTSYFPLEAVSSGVYVMRSAALAVREITAVQTAASSSTVVQCLKRHLMTERANVVSEGTTTGVPAGKPLFSNVEVSALRTPVLGISAYGLQISADFGIETSGTKGQSRYYQDYLGFAAGPAVVVLSDTGSPRPFPAVTERWLLALLHDRAEANGV